ncbi:MAG TPA: hypothetical protein VFG80_05130 [Myxococcota bacterium]|nr:hypothetical protein [Myxococcota bacterium]
MRWARLAASILLVLAAAPARGEEDTWYVQKVTSGDSPLRVENFWSKGSRLRAHSVVAGRPILTLVNGEFYTVIDELAATGVAIRRSPAATQADAKRGRPFGREGDRLLADGAEKVGRETIMGRDCDVYRLTGPGGRREACLLQDPSRVPVRAEEFDRARSATVQVRFLDWSRGFPVADAFFEPDPRIAIERVEYADYLARAPKGPVGPAPVLYRDLLHGE